MTSFPKTAFLVQNQSQLAWQGLAMTNIFRATPLWQTWRKRLTRVSNIWTPWTVRHAVDPSHKTTSEVKTSHWEEDNREQPLKFLFSLFLRLLCTRLWFQKYCFTSKSHMNNKCSNYVKKTAVQMHFYCSTLRENIGLLF